MFIALIKTLLEKKHILLKKAKGDVGQQICQFYGNLLQVSSNVLKFTDFLFLLTHMNIAKALDRK